MTRTHLFTSESVAEGHPDKMADQISDAILDAFLERDPNARVACESFLAHGLIVVAGEFKTDPTIFAAVERATPDIVRRVIREIGYQPTASDPDSGCDPDTAEIRVLFNRQSPEIDLGISHADGIVGAGDQGLMFGYACDETPELFPLALSLAHQLVRRQADLRRSGTLPWLRPDAKSQVTVRYVGDRPVAVEKVVFSTQQAAAVSLEAAREAVREQIIEAVVPAALRGAGFECLVSPAGKFVTGGPKGDTGLTGRKIIVDTYGGSCPHGGGAFSGKDPTKVDRSAAYMARYLAKQVVAAGFARRCTVQLAYAIGVTQPVSLYVESHGTGTVADERIEHALARLVDLTPVGIIRHLDLCRPIYRQTAAYGHFGRQDADFSWERTDRVEALRQLLA